MKLEASSHDVALDKAAWASLVSTVVPAAAVAVSRPGPHAAVPLHGEQGHRTLVVCSAPRTPHPASHGDAARRARGACGVSSRAHAAGVARHGSRADVAGSGGACGELCSRGIAACFSAWMVASLSAPEEKPLLDSVGPTASGKSSLAMKLAAQHKRRDHQLRFGCGVSHDGHRRGQAQRRRAGEDPHHCLDTHWPNEACTAGDYARMARAAIAAITARGKLPIIAGGTGLYLRATLEGLAPSPARDEELRERLRERAASKPAGYLHRLLTRLDASAAAAIMRTIRRSWFARSRCRWWRRLRRRSSGSMAAIPLTGYRILQLGLTPRVSCCISRSISVRRRCSSVDCWRRRKRSWSASVRSAAR